jgi:glyoxylase I family protein
VKITQCLHTAILVADLDRAREFYGGILGLAEKSDRTAKFPGTWYQVGKSQIHLIVNSDFTADTYHQKWGRNPHLALSVDDLETAKTKLETHGYSIQMSASGRAALFVRDPDDNIIELSQM